MKFTPSKRGGSVQDRDKIPETPKKAPPRRPTNARSENIKAAEEVTPSKGALKDYTCSIKEWNKYIAHGSDQTVISRKDWGRQIDRCFCGDIEDSESSQGDLSTAIHPIFAATNWPMENFVTIEGSESNLWKAIKPALQLASNLITSKAALSFFRRLHYGKKRKDPISGRVYLHYEPQNSSKRDKQDSRVLEELNEAAKRLNIVFAAFDTAKVTPESQDGQIHALHVIDDNMFGNGIYMRGKKTDLPMGEREHYIMVNAAYMEYAKDVKQNPNASEYARFAVSLAFSLAHEVGHAYYAHKSNMTQDDYSEPFFTVDQYCETPELGCALDTVLLGDKEILSVFMNPKTGAEMESETIVKTMYEGKIVMIKGHLVSPISSSWTHLFLDQRFWDKIDGLEGDDALNAFHIPGLGDECMVLTYPERNLIWGMRKDFLQALSEGRETGSSPRYLEYTDQDLINTVTIERYERIHTELLSLKIQGFTIDEKGNKMPVEAVPHNGTEPIPANRHEEDEDVVMGEPTSAPDSANYETDEDGDEYMEDPVSAYMKRKRGKYEDPKVSKKQLRSVPSRTR
jgi:hypothetical protein